MSGLLALGVSHRTAPLALREQLALTEGRAVGVLNGLADGSEEFEALPDSHLGFVAEPDQRQAVNKFHDKERPAVGSHAAVQHFGDVRMVHHRQHLPLLLEALQHRLGVHARLDEL